MAPCPLGKKVCDCSKKKRVGTAKPKTGARSSRKYTAKGKRKAHCEEAGYKYKSSTGRWVRG